MGKGGEESLLGHDVENRHERAGSNARCLNWNVSPERGCSYFGNASPLLNLKGNKKLMVGKGGRKPEPLQEWVVDRNGR